MKKIIVSCLLLFSLNCVGQVPTIKPPSKNIDKLTLTGSFHQMGLQYAEKLNEKISDQLQLSKHDLYPLDKDKKAEFERVIYYYIELAKARYPEEMVQFIQGEADSHWAKQNNVGFDDFVFLDQQLLFAMLAYQYNHPHKLESSQACSFVAVNRPEIAVARNFDYPKEYMRLITSYPLLLTMQHSDKKAYPNKVSMLTLPGVISQATLINDKGHYISLNTGDTVGSQYKVFARQSYMSQMLLKMFMVQDYADLKHWVKATAPDLAYIVNLTGPGNNDIASVEDSPFNELQGHYSADNIPENVFSARERSPLSNNTIEPDMDYNHDFLVATNDFHLLDWESYIGHKVQGPSSLSSYLRYRHLVNLLRQRADYSPNRLKQIMEIPLNTGAKDTGALVDYCGTVEGLSGHASFYTVVYSPTSKRLQVRLQQTTQDPHDIGKTHCERDWTDWTSFSLS